MPRHVRTMRGLFERLLVSCTVLAAAGAPLLAAGSAPAAPPPQPAISRPAEQDLAFFESRVRPLLAKHCYGCHAKKVVQGGLRLDLAETARRGGEGGPVIVPGKPDESRLI